MVALAVQKCINKELGELPHETVLSLLGFLNIDTMLYHFFTRSGVINLGVIMSMAVIARGKAECNHSLVMNSITE